MCCCFCCFVVCLFLVGCTFTFFVVCWVVIVGFSCAAGCVDICGWCDAACGLLGCGTLTLIDFISLV